MKTRYLEKYNYLDKEFFSTNIHFTYEFFFNGEEYAINIDEAKGKYMFYDKNGIKSGPYANIYEAIESIKFDGMSIKELLLETGFNFESIG